MWITLLEFGLNCCCTFGFLFSSACDEWRLLPKPDLHRDVNRFGHSAVVSNGWVFSRKLKHHHYVHMKSWKFWNCYLNQLEPDLECFCLPSFTPFVCVFFARSMYVFGGFSSVLLNDVLVYRPPSCQAFLAEEGCVKAGPGVRCIWSRGRCLRWEPSMANRSLTPAPFCPAKAGEKDVQTLFTFLSNLLNQHSSSEKKIELVASFQTHEM